MFVFEFTDMDHIDATIITIGDELLIGQTIDTRLNRPLIERNLKQAEVPDNCTLLPNLRGTAPGMWFEKDNVIYVSLPGVPHEMKGLIQSSVIPKLKEQLTLPAVVHKTLLV